MTSATPLVIDQSGNLIAKNFEVQDQFYPEPDFETARFVNAMLTRFGGASSVLDVGCGFGREAGYLAGLGYEVVGIEPEPAMLARARSDHPAIEFHDAAMPHFDLGRAFDAAICMGSSFLYLYENEAIHQSLLTLARHVRPGGLLLMEMRNGAFFLTKAGWTEWLDIDHEKTITVDGQGGADVTVTNVPFCVAPGYPAVVAKSVQLNLKDTGLNWHITNKNGYYSPFSYSAS